MRLKIDVDTKAINTAFRLFPKELKANTARMLNDMAFAAREAAVEIIGRHYEIRSPYFVQSRFKVKKASKSDPPDKQVAIWGSEEFRGFSGWAEKVGEAPKTGRARRAIGINARGGSMKGIVNKKLRLNRPNIRRSTDFPGDAHRQTQGAINAAYREHGIGATVILGGDHWMSGLYEITREPHKGMNNEQMGPDVEMVQLFDRDIAENRFDWREETMQEVQKTFTPDYLMANYISRAFLGQMPVEYKKGGK
jgi:hypothetical protein